MNIRPGMLVHWVSEYSTPTKCIDTGMWMSKQRDGTSSTEHDMWLTEASTHLMTVLSVDKFCDGRWVVGLLIPSQGILYTRINRNCRDDFIGYYFLRSAM